MRLVQETYHDRQGEEALTYLYEANSYVPLARIDQGKPAANDADARDAVYYFHNDVSGLPEELTDAGGDLVWQARYKVWGNAVQEEWVARAPHRSVPAWGAVQEVMPTSVHVPRPQNLRFQGQYLDRETGLHYNTFRFYDPDIGRFINPDPIGLMGGVNLYQYGPNPISWIDPWGLTCISNWSGNRGRAKAAHDLERNGYKVVAEEVTMKVNGKRIRADFVAQDGNGNIHVFEVKNGTGRLTKNQSASGVFDINSPSNTIGEIGGGVIKPSMGTTGTFTVSTKGAPGVMLGGNGAAHDATFHILRY
ncbi:type IV secretion protein Rhs [Burkholderia cepacia]|nr:type IV secretion protein Rhs [Burkholderia cepacia]